MRWHDRVNSSAVSCVAVAVFVEAGESLRHEPSLASPHWSDPRPILSNRRRSLRTPGHRPNYWLPSHQGRHLPSARASCRPPHPRTCAAAAQLLGLPRIAPTIDEAEYTGGFPPPSLPFTGMKPRSVLGLPRPVFNVPPIVGGRTDRVEHDSATRISSSSRKDVDGVLVHRHR